MSRPNIVRRAAARLMALALALTAQPALAETEISFYGGWQGAAPGQIESATLGDADVTWQGRSLAMPPYYGLRATWWRESGLGYGLEVNHAKTYAADPAALGYDRLEFTDGLNLLTANLWYRASPLGRLQPYAGVGVGVAVPHVDIQPAGQAHTFGYQLTGPAAQWVLGASLPLGGRWAAFGEYKGSFSANHVVLDSGGTLDTDIVTHALNLGLSLRF